MIQAEKINPYQELIVNNAEKIEPLMTQIGQWSILSNVLKLCTTQQISLNESHIRC